MQENEGGVDNLKEIKTIDPIDLNVIQVRSNDPMSLIELAIQGDLDVDKIEKLMGLQERWEAKEARKSFYDALSKFQSDLPIIEKKGKVGFEHKDKKGKTEYSYAKLEDIQTAIKPLLFKNSLSYRFEQINDGDFITVKCVITHRDGHSEWNKLSGPSDHSGKKNAIQATASTVHYLRRYTLTGGFGICVSDEDDDGQDKRNENKKPNKNDFYPNEDFKNNLPHWKKKIADGQNADNIIKFLKTKNINLSPSQIKQVKS